MKLLDKVLAKAESLFTFLNKEPETKLEGFGQAVLALGLFIGFLAAMSYASTFIGA